MDLPLAYEDANHRVLISQLSRALKNALGHPSSSYRRKLWCRVWPTKTCCGRTTRAWESSSTPRWGHPGVRASFGQRGCEVRCGWTPHAVPSPHQATTPCALRRRVPCTCPCALDSCVARQSWAMRCVASALECAAILPHLFLSKFASCFCSFVNRAGACWLVALTIGRGSQGHVTAILASLWDCLWAADTRTQPWSPRGGLAGWRLHVMSRERRIFPERGAPAPEGRESGGRGANDWWRRIVVEVVGDGGEGTEVLVHILTVLARHREIWHTNASPVYRLTLIRQASPPVGERTTCIGSYCGRGKTPGPADPPARCERCRPCCVGSR